MYRVTKYNGQLTGIPRIPVIQARPPNPHSSYSLLTRLRTALVASNPAALPSIPIAQQSGSFVNPQYPPQHNTSDGHRTRALLNPGIPTHFQNYRPIEHGQPIVPSQPYAQYFTPQSPYPNPAMQTRDGHPQYVDPAIPPSSTMSGYPPSPSSSYSSTHACDVCGATFTRPQNLKRHYESQHTTMEHKCPYCQKSYTRVDSLKRHLDRPCDKMPQFAQGGA
jgi:hypothetical protein